MQAMLSFAMGYVQTWMGGGRWERQKYKNFPRQGGAAPWTSVVRLIIWTPGPFQQLDPHHGARKWCAMGMGANTQLWTGCEFVTHDHLSGGLRTLRFWGILFGKSRAYNSLCYFE